MFSPTLGNVRSCNHTAAVKNFFQSWRKVWKPFWLEPCPAAWRLLSPSKSDVNSDQWTSPVWLENFLATKRDCGEFTHLLCIVEFAFPFSCCNFCDLYFVIPFACFPFCVSRRSEYMSARRIAYAWFIYVTLFLAYCVSTLRFLCPPFLKPFYAVPLSIGPKNKHVLFGTKILGVNGVLHC